ncbi:Sec-independent protein translocase protein TatB [Novosphingobium guangzhouense]|uniref:Sec-independent protein translocase protein TatB n=1 Tax=Novosphingobium guangzhouense TaxID=1850347 RepID=A0A2K2FZU2_9SPHN|nr:Sec-independent protein translocase protein TatB [Novosphingobium guangzhouense]PNU04264.1 twin arginine-targeting protein translocase TatB [Novosphingobium guangzhouense]
MFDVGASELLMIVIVAVVVIGPKDMPMALRTAGRWIGKMRKMSNHFRSGIDAMVREAELEEMERKWREQNEAIMKASPQLPSLNPTAEDMQAPGASPASEVAEPATEDASVNDASVNGASVKQAEEPRQAEMHLPPPPP